VFLHIFSIPEDAPVLFQLLVDATGKLEVLEKKRKEIIDRFSTSSQNKQ
jgi:hypothetical protein